MSDLIPDEELIAKIRRAWLDAGPVPSFHRKAQARLRKEWPSLAEPVEALAKSRDRRVSPVTREVLSINTVNNLLYAYDHDPNFGVREFHAKLLALLSVSPSAEVTRGTAKQPVQVEVTDESEVSLLTAAIDRAVSRKVVVTDEMMERAAKALARRIGGRTLATMSDREFDSWWTFGDTKAYLKDARAALTAALGVLPAEVEWEERLAACPKHGTHCWVCPRHKERRVKAGPWVPLSSESEGKK